LEQPAFHWKSATARCKVQTSKNGNRQWSHSVKEATMTNLAQHSTYTLSRSVHGTASTLLLTCALAMLIAAPAQAQIFSVVHSFSGGGGGNDPTGSLIMDAGGNLYGTAYSITYKLSGRGDGWTLTPLRTYNGGPDGENPWGGVVFGPDGALYGTTWLGGFGATNCAGGCGIVFKLTPDANAPRSVLTPWNETVVYPFQGYPNDGQNPAFGSLVFDASGAAYGTAEFGGPGNSGTVYKLTPSDGGWTESVLYAFNGPDGALPSYSLVFDGAGNIYGTTEEGGTNEWGTAFELTPLRGGWVETILHNFLGPEDGQFPSGFIRDGAGNLYGTTQGAGHLDGGNVFEMTYSDGTWNFNVLYNFNGGDDAGPSALLTMDAAGNIYGTTLGGGRYGWGSVFELSPSGSSWNFTDIYDFTDGADGGWPRSQLVLDSSGSIYGTASVGGDFSGCRDGCGTVWKITR